MAEEEEAISLEALKTLAAWVGLRLDDAELAKLKPSYDLLRSEALGLREQDLQAIEPAFAFAPDWT